MCIVSSPTVCYTFSSTHNQGSENVRFSRCFRDHFFFFVTMLSLLYSWLQQFFSYWFLFLYSCLQVCAHGGVEVDPDETDRYNRELAQNHRRDTRSVVVNNYPNLIPHAAVTEKCLYTVGLLLLSKSSIRDPAVVR